MHGARGFLGGALALAMFVGTAGAEGFPPGADLCAPPISTCRMGPLPLAAELAPSLLLDDCPAGFRCTCVPSEPGAEDCAAQVCVADPDRECRTACDCEPGLGCFEGRCLPGIVPVYCCDSDLCPAEQQCQHREGGFDRCRDPLCSERVRNVNQAVQRIVNGTHYCVEDRDCVRIDTSTRCIGTCGAFVNARRAKSAVRHIGRIDAKVCEGFQEHGCPFLTPSCQVQRPACVENRCIGVGLGDLVPDPGAGLGLGRSR